MPGLDQLKRFNYDMLSIGDEAAKRAARGEKPITLPIPAGVKDADDSDDFVLGMPEGTSDMDGGRAASSKSGTVDVSDIIKDVGALDDGEIDFSQFEDKNTNETDDTGGSDILKDMGGLDSLEPLDDGMDIGNAASTSDAAEQGLQTEGAENIPNIDTAKAALDAKAGTLDELNTFDMPDAPDTSDTPDVPDIPSIPDVAEYIPDAAEEVPSAPSAEDANAGDTKNNDDNGTVETEEADRNDADIFDDTGEISLNEEFPEGLDNVIPDKGEMETEEDSAALPVMDEKKTAEAKDDFDVDELLSGFDFGDDEQKEDAATSDAAKVAAADEVLPLDDEEVKSIESAPEAESALEAEAVPEADSAPQAAASVPAKDGEEEAEAQALPEEGVVAANNPLARLDFSMDDDKGTANIDISDALSGLDFDGLDKGDANKSANSGEENVPLETFDAPEMEGVDFSSDSADTGFELDEDALHIPGYTDTETAQDVHAMPPQKGTAEEDGGENNNLPPNTLTDKQYDKFKGNFVEYPLNVRQAFENMIVQNEFTDDAQFEVVEKVLKKSSARHVASHLEKMLDVSLPVPRDYEKRTASEYAAYKSSFKYQLYNRIIPAIIVCAAAVLLAVGIFFFSRKFIYRPIMANRLYKQGYALLEADEYPQSEGKFVEATEYKMIKKWFYKYAHGYRERKQYQRAQKMYGNILYCFNHDKQAGIEYAKMECYDLANYEKAEEVARREVLDYHINDADGILLLGDVLLEWATEKDDSKFDEAKKQYALLMQLYGENDLYMSRMMRYFIRTDNLREVLPLKEHFYANKKAKLGAEDWTELSGFMLDKLYGALSPVDEELRIRIADVMDMLRRAVRADPSNPVAMYNLSRYYVNRNRGDEAKSALAQTLSLFDAAQSLKARDMYKELNTYRLLGEEYAKGREYIKAQETYTDGITLYEKEKRNNDFIGDSNVGRLYADEGDIDYFIRGDMGSAFNEYTSAIDTNCDTSSLRYRLGYIYYNRGDLSNAMLSFIKANEDNHDDMNLLLAMANTLSLRDDNYGAQSYYERLIASLDTIKAQKGVLLPQVRGDQAEIVDLYLKASNNLGVTLGRLARRTGNSAMNANAMINLTASMRAWDALTRNQSTMVRLQGSNLAEQNLKYMTHPASEFEPAIYTEIKRTLTGETELRQ